MSSIAFGPFRLDTSDERLWHGRRVVPLAPKSFAVLRYLVERRNRLVRKQQLLDALWPEVHVTDAVIKVCVRELRKALGDDAAAPTFIETIHRRGYRFIGRSADAAPSRMRARRASRRRADAQLVGREPEMARLEALLDTVGRGSRQIVFVTGEAGIGKSTLVEAFLERAARRPFWIARGDCIQQYGVGEAYMPVLDAWTRLCKQPGGTRVVDLLARHAPTWLVQLPGVAGRRRVEAARRYAIGATRERMLREMADAVDVLTMARPLVLWLEDLHWCDPSTLALIAALARRGEPARLLIVGTFRPAELGGPEHPLNRVKDDLHARGRCVEMPLAYLDAPSVREYLVRRWPPAAPHGRSVDALAAVVHQRTRGNPLFMAAVADHLVKRKLVAESGQGWRVAAGATSEAQTHIPDSVQGMIAQQIASLPPEDRRIVEAASVAGVEFSSASIAAALDLEPVSVEERCVGLARQSGLFRTRGETRWRDGTVAGAYGFSHALYQELAYGRIPIARRAQLHRRIARRLEAAYGDTASEIAAELAGHFDRGGDMGRAVHHYLQAARRSLQRSGYDEAARHAMSGLELLADPTHGLDRSMHELALRHVLGLSLAATKGYGALDVEAAYAGARSIAPRLENASQVVPVLVGVWAFYLIRGDLAAAGELASRISQAARLQSDRAPLVWSHLARGVTSLHGGALTRARTFLERGLQQCDARQHADHLALYGQDPVVTGSSYLALCLWLLGYPNQALARSAEAVALADRLAHPFSRAFAWTCAAELHVKRRDTSAAREAAEAVIRISRDQGFAHWHAAGTILHGWARIGEDRDAALERIDQGLNAWRAVGAQLNLPWLLSLRAEACARLGQADRALDTLRDARALIDASGERYYAPEICRLHGEVALRRGDGEAARSFQQALALARRQQARPLELAAAVSLSRLWHRRGQTDRALRLVQKTCRWFTEGFDTPVLQEAQALVSLLREHRPRARRRLAHTRPEEPATYECVETPALSARPRPYVRTVNSK